MKNVKNIRNLIFVVVLSIIVGSFTFANATMASDDCRYWVKCSNCGNTVYSVSGIEHHDETASGIDFTNGEFALDGLVKYNLPVNLIGEDKEAYMLKFKFTLDSILDAAGLYNNGNGRNILLSQGSLNSAVRIFRVENPSQGSLDDTVEIGTLTELNGRAERFVQLKTGESVEIALVVEPATSSVDIYINGEYKYTRDGETNAVVPSSSQWFFGYNLNNAIKATVSEVSLVTKNGDSDVKIVSGATIIDDENNIFKCSCGAKVTVKGEDYMSKNGVDRILGLRSLTLKTLSSTEDTYVSAGTSSRKNFNDDTALRVKNSGAETPDDTDRITLIKFDISAAADFDVQKAWVELYCTSRQDADAKTTIHVYSCKTNDWDESKVTYVNVPEKESLETTIVVSRGNVIKFDITDYVKFCREFGEKEISLYLEGDASTPYAVSFSTSADKEKGPKLILGDSSYSFTTELEYNDEDPWENAMRNVSTWFNRWEEIKARGDSDTNYVVEDESEYSITVGTSKNFDKNKTKYTDTSMRNISTLKGYTANTSETQMLDVYGGLMDESMRQEATGYFYTKKMGDRWYTFDPLGYPFFRVGVTSVKIRNNGWRGRAIATYGSEIGWTEAITDKLKGLGFNSIGGFSGFEDGLHTSLQTPLTLTHIISVMGNYATQIGARANNTVAGVAAGGYVNDIMTVFDPAFVISADETIRNDVSEHATNPFVYGWMTDNEMPSRHHMLDNYLALDPTDIRFVHSYATAWTFMFMKTGNPDVSFTDVTDELRMEFKGMVYDKYFEVVCGALERYAPNHQYMGCRFNILEPFNEYMVRVAGYWCDVITYNYYLSGTPDFEHLGNLVKWAGKPLVISEWYIKGIDTWENDSRVNMSAGAGSIVKTQDERGKYYQNYALAILESKICVGLDWLFLQDLNPDDYSNGYNEGNKGILDVYGNEYVDLTKYINELNNQKYNLINYFDER